MLDDLENVHIETFPNRYVGPRVSITIRVREKDAEWITIKTLQSRIALDLSMINTVGGEVKDKINVL